jgi:predicted nucleotidyltransferase
MEELRAEAKNHKNKSLRGTLGLPITGVLYSAPQFSVNEDEGLGEMIQVAKDLQEEFGKAKKNYEVYDVEEAAVIPAYSGEFQPDMNDKEVGSFPENNTCNEDSELADKTYKVQVKNNDTGKIIAIDYSDPNLKVKKQKAKKPIQPELYEVKDEEPKNQNPRKWSAKYWETTQIKSLLAEIINPDQVDVQTLKFNEELNPLIWDGEEIKPEVRDQLLKIATEFIKSCKLDDYKYKDIVFVGSMANYTYTPQSDIDIHIIVDFNQFKVDEEILGEYFDTKKDMWSNTHDIRIKGHVVECYVQNSQEPYTSLGVYSLAKNEWIRKPVKKFITVDEGNVQLKAAAFMNAIDKLEERFKNGEDVVIELKKLKDKIKNMRKNGLYKEGEYSTENLVFKVLRNSGYLEKLINLKNNNMDQNLSL